jgi:hypothetical protein
MNALCRHYPEYLMAAAGLGIFMISASYVRWKGRKAVRCAKLHHHNSKRCIFRCGYRKRGAGSTEQLSIALR